MGNDNNRWIKKAELIPWNEIEKEYADLFKGKNGQVAKPLRLALGALLIQIEYGYSDEETALQIHENPYLQFFCGMGGYEDKSPFDPSLMVHFRKRLTYIDGMLQQGKLLTGKFAIKLQTIRKLYAQQLYMYETKTHKIEGK